MRIAAGAATFVVSVAGGAVAFAARWGPYSVLYVVAAYGLIAMPLILLSIAGQVRGNRRRVKHKRASDRCAQPHQTSR